MPGVRPFFVNGAYAHPRGSPHRRMTWDEVSALFKDTVAEALPAPALDRVLDLVAGLDRDTHPRDITATFVAAPGWLDK